MTLTPEDVRSLIDAFEASDWTDMSVTVGGTRLELSRTGRALTSAAPSQPATAPPQPMAAQPEPTLLPQPAPPPAGSDGSGPNTEPAADPVGPQSGAVFAPTSPAPAGDGYQVVSPTVGLFWRSPSPGAPPFAEVGARVESDDTVCIVEVMKLMNHIKAGIAGTVRAVAVGNGEMVEHGQTLFVIDPAG